MRGLRIPDGEKVEDFESRITDFYNRLMTGKPHQNILVVTHAGVMQVIMEKILGRAWREIGNCQGFRISYTAARNIKVDPL